MPVFQQQPPPSQRSKPNPTRSPKRVQGRQGHYAAAAAAAAVMFACSATVAAAHAAHQIHVAASYSLGTWSTANLSVARHYLAATSLPNAGVAIFAGGQGIYCHVYFRIFACCGVRVMVVMRWLSGRRGWFQLCRLRDGVQVSCLAQQKAAPPTLLTSST
jgi:hypothetical protein